MPEFSTSGALLLRRPHVFDVNGYYRDLGVDPYATRKQIREAYTARGGPASPRLTYILKQLLQDDVRAAYDATPLGAIFFDDVIAEAVRRRVTQETADRRLAGEFLANTEFTEEEVDMAHLMGRAFSLIDKESRREEDDLGHQQWAWYEWKITTEPISHGLVARWRNLLVAVAQDCGLAVRLAVGIFDGAPLHPGPQVFVTPVGYRLVAFLHQAHEPDEHDAVEALHQFLDFSPKHSRTESRLHNA